MTRILPSVFFVLLGLGLQAQNITRFEYFFDTDPGFGAGLLVNVTPAAAINDFDIPISTATLSAGFHKLYIRAQNANNEWTQTHTRSFYLMPLAAPVQNISQIEYYIDTDPGIGNATQVSFTAATTISNLAIDISIASITPGFHKLYVRSKSSDGQWTHTHLRSFYVVSIPASQNLVAFEYFFDADPGFDNGTSVAITPAAPSVTNQNILADVSGLSIGTHTINIRAKDSGGEWTHVSIGVFSVSAALPPTITSFTPTRSAPGTTVMITGTNFGTTPLDNVVFFGATQAMVTAASGTQLTVTVPTGATYSPITVLNTSTGLLAYSKDNYTPTFTPSKSDITTADFDPKVDFTTGTSPFSTAIGDLDGDGKADLAVTNYGTNTLSVFRNTGSSGTISYAPKIDFATGSLPYSVAFGDLDGDGKADLVVTNYANSTVSVFRNTSVIGTISFAPKVDFGTGGLPYAVAINDIDNDGKTDIVTANDSNGISILRNTGSPGTVSYATRVDFTTPAVPFFVAIADLDGDGKVDLVTPNNTSSSISVFRNTSTPGTISYAANVDFTTGTNPTSVAIGDLDFDGKADLAVTNYSSSTLSVFRNTSTSGTISYAAKVDVATAGNPFSVSIGDLNGDSKADLAVAQGNGTLAILRNTSGGVGNIDFAPKIDLTTGAFPRSISIGDLDGDGKSDLAVANSGSASISVIRNNAILAPVITGFTPTSGPAGTTVTITGSNFTGTTAVTFGGTVATSFTVVSATTITATTGAGATGKISVTTSSGTATSSNDYTFTLPDLISISTQPASTTACEGSNATFTLAAGGTTNLMYQWQKFNGTAFTDIANGSIYSGATSASLVINTTGTTVAGDYRCKISGDNSLDKFSNTATLVINITPAAPTATSNSACGAASVTLNATGGSNGQFRWYLQPTNGTALSGEVNSAYTTPLLNSSASYYVSVNNGICESARTTVTATIFTVPAKPVITSNETITAGIIQLCKNSITLTAPAGFNYTWSNGATAQSITSVQPGNYSLIVKDANNCTSPASDVVQVVLDNSCVNSPPVINTTALTTTMIGPASFDLASLISDPDDNLDPGSLQVVGQTTQRGGKATLTGFILTLDYMGINFSGSDLITIRVCDIPGACVDQDLTIEVVGEIIVYNGISPNGDGANDKWIIEYIDVVPGTERNQVKIYNRWGDLVWEVVDYNNISNVFTGNSKNGSELPAGTYFYKIEFATRNGATQQSLSGYLSLKR